MSKATSFVYSLSFQFDTHDTDTSLISHRHLVSMLKGLNWSHRMPETSCHVRVKHGYCIVFSTFRDHHSLALFDTNGSFLCTPFLSHDKCISGDQFNPGMPLAYQQEIQCWFVFHCPLSCRKLAIFRVLRCLGCHQKNKGERQEIQVSSNHRQSGALTNITAGLDVTVPPVHSGLNSDLFRMNGVLWATVSIEEQDE